MAGAAHAGERDEPPEHVRLKPPLHFWLVNRWCGWGAGVAAASAEYEEVLGCLGSLITQKVRADTGNRGNQWELMAKYVQVGGRRWVSDRLVCLGCSCF